MRVSIPTLAVLSISLWVQGCGGLNRAASLKMLDERAAYETPSQNDEFRFREGGVEGFRNAPVPTRTRTRVAAVYVHPHEMPSRDYFWGGWVSVVVEPDRWVMEKPQLIPKARAVESLPPVEKKSEPVKLMMDAAPSGDSAR